ncbi:M20 family metallopeptidase [Elstera cyanobacteriorum]|uniref:M20 family metallopeptidase n=1 Tax=Elstera cyanobacteriorum TaxID=2022747 RepID=UPI0023538FDC|nr:ArgE/DapE family deacylase [Elstera cyanobacteriorum]MCK6444129.1 ArgE/DapE family deacylase [Elstera cyanobacteriorum]
MSFNPAAVRPDLVQILTDLIARPSPFPSGDCTAINAYTADRLKRAGYQVEILARSAETEAKGYTNVVAKLGGGSGPRLVFNAHADTVAVGERSMWHTDPFTAVEKDGLIYGLGAGNGKGNMAVQIWLAEEIARRGGPTQGEVAFTFVSDEENLGPDGMFYLREVGAIKPDVLVLGAQTENQLITAERGVMWVRIETTGKAAHAGNPAAGDNAIMRMLRVLGQLDATLAPRLAARTDGPMQSTNNIGMIRGGHNTNVVPNFCWVELDRRVLPTEKVPDAYAEMKAIVDALPEPEGTVRIELLRGTNGFRAPEGGQGVGAFQRAIQGITGKPAQFLNATGVSDGRYFADDGIEIINFGPGAGAQGHAANESVPIDQMLTAAEIQLAMVQDLLGVK